MLICASQEKNFLTFQPVITRDDVGKHFFVSVADVRGRVRVIDRRCDVKSLRHA
jgi:hypothetical protein